MKHTSMIKDPVLVVDYLAGKSEPKLMRKWWGHEITYFNDKDLYCSKALVMKKDGYTSLHFHKYKHETLLVVSGTLLLEVVVDKESKVFTLNEGEAWVVPPGYPHRLKAVNSDVHIIESSTWDTPEDSIRIS